LAETHHCHILETRNDSYRYNPLQSGAIQKGHIHAELGDIVVGLKPGRTNSQQITFFKSVGVAVQDVVAGQLTLQNAESQNLGAIVNL
jgi:alanine dehydrogenase